MTKKIKRIISIALAGVCTALVVVMAIVTNGFGLGGSSARPGFSHNDQLSFGNFFGNGIMLTANADEVSEPSANAETGESAVRLTATVTPANAYVKGIDWTVAWKDAASEWATGKTVTDYVTVTPTTDSTMTADVNCLQEFGEQIIVTATIQDNVKFSASCTLDYAKRVQDLSGNVNYKGTVLSAFNIPVSLNRTYNFNETVTESLSNYTVLDFVAGSESLAFNGTYTLGTGTITEGVSESYTLEVSDSLRAAMEAQGLTITLDPVNIESNTRLLFCRMFFYDTWNNLSGGTMDLFIDAITSNTGDHDFAICYTVSTPRDSKTARCKVKVSVVERLSVDQSSVVF